MPLVSYQTSSTGGYHALESQCFPKKIKRTREFENDACLCRADLIGGLSHVDESCFGTLRPSHLRSCAEVHLVHGSVLGVCIRLWVDVATRVVSRGRHVRRGVPAHTAHVGAASSAAHARLRLLETGLERRWRTVASRVGGGPHGRVIGTRRCRRRASNAEMRGKRAVLLQVLEVTSMAGDAAGSREIHARRHRHGSLSRRRCSHQGRSMVRHVITFGTRLRHDLGLGGGEGGGSGCRCLFDSSAVVVLVPCKRSATRKSLLTIGVRTLVWSLAGVSASVTSQGAAIAERLCGVVSNRKASESQGLRNQLTLAQVSQWCGFSPVCTRWWTVRAERWINCLPQLG